ncbi:MAG: hypothetical protein L0Y54_11775, partial [Sporichthyaceae bacterium]|nr:hypothetical protein [Sporichthyaceae bacterium]
GTSFTDRQLHHPAVRQALASIDVYDLPAADMAGYVGLIVAGSVDQELLWRERARIRDFLDGGRVLAFSGHLFRPWLPGAGLFVPKTIRSFRAYTVRLVRPHAVFAGVHEDDLTFRRGVAGFFARGHHPPPDGAEIIATLADGEPVVYVDRVSSGGTMLVHAGNDLLGYAGGESTAGRIAPQLVDWIRTEQASIRGRRSVA